MGTSSIKVWIDAICLNQVDDVEKAVHTRKMNVIYHCAEEVVVWLGQGHDGSDLALDKFDTLNELLAPIIETNTPEQTAFIDAWFTKDDLDATVLPNTNDPMWPALRHILTQSWFSRLWTFQEAVLAKEIIVAHGTKQVPWSALTTLVNGLLRTLLIDFIGVTTESTSVIRDTYRSLAHFDTARSLQANGHVGIYGFPNLLGACRFKKVSLPIDKLYGVLGLGELFPASVKV